MYYKGYKIRIYPTREQEEKFWRHIGACRFIWNYMLAEQERRYKNGEKHMSRFDMIKALTPLKQEEDYAWLYEVSNASLQITCSDLHNAYQQFFSKTAKYPKFKSRKRSKVSYPICSDRIYFEERFVQIQKVGKVKYKTDFELPQGHGHKFVNPRISLVNNKWMLSFNLECESQASELNDFSIGIDLGVKEQAVVAYEDKQIVFHNINHSRVIRTLKKRIKYLQRSISRKYEASKKRTGRYEKTRNIEKEEEKLRRLYYRINCIRQNYLHQTTHQIVSLLPRRVVMEDLNVTGMMKNKHLAKAIAEQCFYEFIRQIQYKCEWSGIEFVQVDRFYPSSKTCSCCGAIKHDLKLSDRMYKCGACGAELDRDYNAALNLSRYVA